MKASELVVGLQRMIERFGDPEVFICAEMNGGRTQQKVEDLLASESGFILESKESRDADPLNQLPIRRTHLRSVRE